MFKKICVLLLSFLLLLLCTTFFAYAERGISPDKIVIGSSETLTGHAGFIGYGGTSTTLAVLGTIERNKIPLLFPLTGAQQLRFPFNRYVFNLRNSY